MIRSKALATIISVAAATALVLAGLLLSSPTPAVSHPNYAWKPGCHCGAPKTTTTKAPTTTTAKKPTTTTTKKPMTTTTKKPTTTTTKAPTTTLAASTIATAASTTTTVAATTTSTETTTTTQAPTTTDAARALAAGLALSSTGQPPDGSGPAGGPPEDGVSAGTIDTVAAGAPEEDLAPEDAATVDAAVAGGELSPPQYYVSPVAVLFLLVYATSFVLYRTKSIRVATHRKIWNFLLMATFLITGALGIVLAIGISRDPPWLLPRALLFWHVETGVVMSFISFFHLGWHLRYYLAIVSSRRAAPKRPLKNDASSPEGAGYAQG